MEKWHERHWWFHHCVRGSPKCICVWWTERLMSWGTKSLPQWLWNVWKCSNQVSPSCRDGFPLLFKDASSRSVPSSFSQRPIVSVLGKVKFWVRGTPVWLPVVLYSKVTGLSLAMAFPLVALFPLLLLLSCEFSMVPFFRWSNVEFQVQVRDWLERVVDWKNSICDTGSHNFAKRTLFVNVFFRFNKRKREPWQSRHVTHVSTWTTKV